MFCRFSGQTFPPIVTPFFPSNFQFFSFCSKFKKKNFLGFFSFSFLKNIFLKRFFYPQFQLTNPFSCLSLQLFQVPLQTLPNWGPVRIILRNSQCSSLDPQCSSVLLSAPQCSSVLIIGPHLLLAPPYHTYLLLTTPHWSSLLLSPHRSSLSAYALGPIRMS